MNSETALLSSTNRYVTILRAHRLRFLSLPASRFGHAAAARVDHILWNAF